jgi:hypothetical protein
MICGLVQALGGSLNMASLKASLPLTTRVSTTFYNSHVSHGHLLKGWCSHAYLGCIILMGGGVDGVVLLVHLAQQQVAKIDSSRCYGRD